MRINKAKCLICIIFVLSACGTVKLYEGPEIPKEKIVIIKAHPPGTFSKSFPLILESVNGKEIPFMAKNVSVNPGNQKVMYSYSGTVINGMALDIKTGIVNFEAEAGETYLIGRGHGNAFVVKAKTKEKVKSW